jgi:Predicted UDP-glucose 6-dehydrogenase
MSLPVVGFAGMTHLGINTLAATAARGFATLGYTPDAALAGQLRAHRMPVVEPDLDRYIAENAERIGFTDKAADLAGCDIVYIAADVPTDDGARSDLAPILALIDDVAAHLRDDAVMVVLCQVPPGFTRAITSVPHARLIYQVETLIFGRAVERAMFPERFIVGCAAPEAGLPAGYRQVLDSFGCPILPMRYESAELAKISINFCLVASVCVANTLAEVSEAIGADWAEIAPALKLDKRIGQFAYLTPGLGISGGNLERDLRTVIDIGSARGTDVGVVEAWIRNSGYRKDWLWRTLRDQVLAAQPRPRIAVLGLAYKENTHSTKNSPSLKLLAQLEGHDVVVHDPVVSPAVVPWSRGAATVAEAVQGADVLVLATPWPEYRSIEVGQLAAAMDGRIVIDPYRLIDGPALAARGFIWHTLGMPPFRPKD